MGDGRADCPAGHRRHGADVQVVTDRLGQVLWTSPTLPSRYHDLPASRAHRIVRIIRICERRGAP
ncbi:hypothetical protein GCM10010275_48860 [Streptomyces litmocidini]|nr:hypothetical protein GCM10010275_48860 [Streptomyces litmocidini]